MKAATKVPRTRFSQYESDTDMDNPEGTVINTGELVPVGDILDALEELDVPLHVLMDAYARFDAQYFRWGATIGKGLWREPGWDILVTTHFTEIDRIAREEYGVESLPYTSVMAIPRGPNGEAEDPELLDWVMHGTHSHDRPLGTT